MIPVRVALVVLFPAWVAVYFVALERVRSTPGGHDGYLAYAGFAVVAAAAYAVVYPVAFPVVPPGMAAVALALGAAMYALDAGGWALWNRLRHGRGVERGGATVAACWPVLVVAPAEEVLYRGGLGVLVGPLGWPGYVAVSALAFGVHHCRGGRKEVLAKTANGAVYCGLFLEAGVLAAALAHLGYNAAFVYARTRPAGG